MKRSLLPATVPLVMLLAACSGAPDNAAAPEPAETMMPVEPDGGIGDGAGPPEGLGTPAIPAPFHGVWDYVDGSCAPESDLRIEIRPESIGFYESLGELTAIDIASPDDITVTLAMEGEGETWDMQRRFVLSDDGATLTPQAVGEENFEPMPLKKCE